MGKVLKYSLFITLELSLLTIIIVLAFKIKALYSGKVKGIQYVSYVDKQSLIFDPEDKQLKYFYEPKPNSIVTLNPQWLGYTVKNHINSDGLNKLHDYTVPKLQNTFRIITLGDSFTYGWYVNSGENWSDYLEELLNKQLRCKDFKNFDVINLGVPGYDIEYTVERYKKRGIKYDPDLVIWLLTSGDFRKINELLSPIREGLKNQGIPEFDPISKSYLATEKAINLFLNNSSEQYILDYQRNALSNSTEYFKNNLLLVSFVSLPNKYKAIIKDFVKIGHNYKWLDSVTDVDKYDSYRLLDFHPNKQGHKKIAEEIFTYLNKNLFTECSVIK